MQNQRKLMIRNENGKRKKRLKKKKKTEIDEKYRKSA